MGVKNLWSILEPARERRSLDSLEGKTVAVDLGIWVCEMQASIRNPKVLKPYLRNLFFRISALLQRNINVVVVADGKPPELKRQAMLERQKNRYSKIQGDKNGRVGRSKFNGHLRECLEMLRHMGVSVIESDGEAESTCAAMNAVGIVDAVITDDSDAFLYGARLVVRNFNLEGKEPEADFYYTDVIQDRLDLSRNKLIALGVLLGSDYCSAGVPGVGKETALKYIQWFSDKDDELLLPYLKSWNERCGDSGCRIKDSKGSNFWKLDKALRVKAATAKDLIIDAVIEEYLRFVSLDPIKISWRLPNLVSLEAFFTRHLEWVSNYTVSKVVPLITLWQLVHGTNHLEIVPEKITKTRTRNRHSCYEVQWRKLNYDSWTVDEFYETVEKAELVERKLKPLVEEYACRVAKKSKGKRTNRKAAPKKASIATTIDQGTKDVADLSQILENSLVILSDDEENRPPARPVHEKIRVENTIEHCEAPTGCTKEEEQRRLSAFFPRPTQWKQLSVDPDQVTAVQDSPLPLWKRIGLRDCNL